MKKLPVLFAVILSATTWAQEVQVDDYSILFISDLHLGVGRDPEDLSRWHATEDFRWHDAFHDFLHTMVSEGSGKIDLVILGDFLELWQSVADDCDNQEIGADLGCSKEQALERMDRVLAHHRRVFEDLSWFAEQGENTVNILAGNHDVALAFPEARNKLLSSFGDMAQSRVVVKEIAIWMSPDGRIIAEHGQQIGADPNKFDGWPDKPFIEIDGTTYLAQPWGESFVQELFNEVEAKYPIIDNLSAEIAGFKYATKSASWSENLVSIGKALRFFFTQTSWRQARQILGEDGIPEWRLQDTQSQLDSDNLRWQFLIGSLPARDPLRIALTATADLPPLGPLSLEEIEAVCDRRYLQKKNKSNQDIELCAATGKLGATAQRIADTINPKARDRRFQDYFSDLIDGGTVGQDFDHYVYGHTHKVEIKYDPYDGDPDGIIVYNDGAWQRTVTPDVLCQIAANEGWDDEEVLARATPEHLPACYPFVTANWNQAQEKLTIMNLYWVDGPAGGNWETRCTLEPEVEKDCK